MTHKHSRPPLALAHSLPRRRRRRRRRAGQTHQRAPTQRAGNQPVWHQGTEGGAGEGKNRDPENSTRSRPVRPGEPAPTAAAILGAQVGGGERASQAERVRPGVTGARGKAQTRTLPGPFLSPLLSLQGDVPDTQRSAKDVPKLLLRLKGPARHGSVLHTGQDCEEPFRALNRRRSAWN